MVRVGVSYHIWYLIIFGVILRNLSTVGHRVLLNPYTTGGHRDT